jgi:hypothetical protein
MPATEACCREMMLWWRQSPIGLRDLASQTSYDKEVLTCGMAMDVAAVVSRTRSAAAMVGQCMCSGNQSQVHNDEVCQ